MVEKKTKTEAAEPKTKAVKKPAAPKAEAKPVAAKAAASSKVAAPKKAEAKSGKTVTITQTGSAIGRQGYQRATLIGLGLNKLHRTRTLDDTPAIRGMIAKVKHLLTIVEA